MAITTTIQTIPTTVAHDTKAASTVCREVIPDIPESYWDRIDPEWRHLWEEHGSKVQRADLVTIDEVRHNPGKYSFTYATCSGMY